MNAFFPDKDIIYLYEKRGQISLWCKNKDLWFRFLAKTPKGYADAMAKILNQKADYSACWWGQGDDSPDKQKFKFLHRFKVVDIERSIK